MKLVKHGHAYFPHIDGLRAIAVLAVIAYHLDNAWLPGGFSGVDVFFVISGFVVSASVGARERESFPAFVGYFLSRRFQRIAPALVACLLCVALVDAVLVPDAWLSHRNQVTGRFAFFGFSNVVMARASNDYFSPIADLNPYTHTWSLGVEEQFYLIFPVLFFLWARGRRWRIGVAALTATASIASLVYGHVLAAQDPTRAFYLLGSRFWEIGTGVLLYQCQTLLDERGSPKASVPAPMRAALAAAAVALVAVGFLVSDPGSFPVPGAWMAVLGTLGLLVLVPRMDERGVLPRVLSSAPLVAIGRVSYSLYLWHWPVFVLFRWTIGLQSPGSRALALLVAAALACASYRFIEVPVRRSTRLAKWPRGVVVALGLLLIFGGLGLMKRITHSQPSLSVSTVTRHARDWYPDGGRVAREGGACPVTATSIPLARGSIQTFRRQGCGAPGAVPDLYVIGDSHAAAFAEMVAGYARETGVTVHLYDNEGCPFLSLQPWRDGTAPCAASSRRVLGHVLDRLKQGDVVFLPSLRMPRFIDPWAKDDAPGRGMGANARYGAPPPSSMAVAASVLSDIHARGARVVIEAPNLLLKVPLFRCADVYNAGNPVCAAGADIDRAEFEHLRAPMLAAVTTLSQSIPGGSVWDPFPVLCPPGSLCHAYREGRPLFFDGDHLSGFANRLLLPSFVTALQPPASPHPLP